MERTIEEKRWKALVAIDEERNYQVQRWGDKGANKSIECYLTYIQHYLNEAIRQETTQPETNYSLHTIRKIAALAVACMEDNGVETR